jgi:beta-lactamase class D
MPFQVVAFHVIRAKRAHGCALGGQPAVQRWAALHSCCQLFAAALLILPAPASGQSSERSCVVVSDNGGPAESWVGSAAECQTRLSPASTYKIPHALIGLETEVITETTIFKWDGVRRPNQAKWNQDHTVLSAMKPSVLWFFQTMAPQIGARRAHQWLERMAYGNADTSGDITLYWVNGTLRVSPEEQLAFLRRFYDGTLPVAKSHIDRVRASMEQLPGTVENARGVTKLEAEWPKGVTLNSKTGATSMASGEGTSWLVGKLTVDQRQIVFASAVWRAKGGVDDTLEAARLAVKTFVDRGVLRRGALQRQPARQ